MFGAPQVGDRHRCRRVGSLLGPSVTWLESMRTPPSSTGRPVMSTVSTPLAPLLSAVLSRTVTRPAALGWTGSTGPSVRP